MPSMLNALHPSISTTVQSEFSFDDHSATLGDLSSAANPSSIVDAPVRSASPQAQFSRALPDLPARSKKRRSFLGAAGGDVLQEEPRAHDCTRDEQRQVSAVLELQTPKKRRTRNWAEGSVLELPSTPPDAAPAKAARQAVCSTRD